MNVSRLPLKARNMNLRPRWEEDTESAATPDQDEPVAEVVADAALAVTAVAAAAATAERPTAPALETCGLDPALAQSMILRLREAEPRLSVWLGIVLEGVEEAGGRTLEASALPAAFAGCARRRSGRLRG